jgi:hypothetical protein
MSRVNELTAERLTNSASDWTLIGDPSLLRSPRYDHTAEDPRESILFQIGSEM